MSAYLRAGRADALYFAIAITVTIIEVAIIATTPALGIMALEYALITQLFISVLVEFCISYILVNKLGIVRATHLGFTFKTISCTLFFSGVAIASYSFSNSWILILASFLLDAMGTGLLKAAFRPAYSAMHYSVIGKPADYIFMLRGFGVIRLGLPCAILLVVGIANLFSTSINFLYTTFFTVFACRIIQVFFARTDLRATVAGQPFTTTPLAGMTTSILLKLKTAPQLWACYTAGTILESIVLMYGIGLIYKHKGIIALPDAVTWMGASAVSLCIYLISHTGAGYVVRYWHRLNKSRFFLAISFCMTGAVVFLLLQPPEHVGYLVGLLGFCFFASIVSILMVRYACTQFLLLFSEQESAEIFLWVEFGANIALIILVGITIIALGPQNIFKAVSIFFGFSTMIAIVFHTRLRHINHQPRSRIS